LENAGHEIFELKRTISSLQTAKQSVELQMAQAQREHVAEVSRLNALLADAGTSLSQVSLEMLW
jgi:hypothetical protein